MIELASWPALSPESPCSLDSDCTANLESDLVMTSVLTLRDHVKIAAQTSLCCSLVRAEQSRAGACLGTREVVFAPSWSCEQGWAEGA